MPSIIQHANDNLYSLVEDNLRWCSIEVQRICREHTYKHMYMIPSLSDNEKINYGTRDLQLRREIFSHLQLFKLPKK